MWRSLALIFAFTAISGCSFNTVEINDLDVPFATLQKIVHDNLPIRTKRVSINGREFVSDYFLVSKDGEYTEAPNTKVRMLVAVTILNDRRPYNITIQAPVEVRDSSGQYSVDHYDDGLARVMSRRIQKALHDRRDDRNIIDDFRPY